jgi:hypothetical protein
VTIFYGSVPTFDKLRFRFRFWLLASTVPVLVPVQVLVPVPVPVLVLVPVLVPISALLQDIKSTVKKNVWKNLASLRSFYIVSFLQENNKINKFLQMYCKMRMKIIKWRKSNTEFYTLSTFVILFYYGASYK